MIGKVTKIIATRTNMTLKSLNTLRSICIKKIMRM